MAKPAKAKYEGGQVIRIRFHGPTRHRPARYSATTEAGRVYFAKDAIEPAPGCPVSEAARQYADRMQWGGDWRGAYTGAEYVFIRIQEG